MSTDRIPTRATANRFLRNRNVAVLATRSEYGELSSSPINYILSKEKTVRFVTGETTAKYLNISNNGHIALTVVDNKIAVNISGHANVVDDQETINATYRKIGELHKDANDIPNVFKHQHGQPVVIEIEIIRMQYIDYTANTINSDKVVTNL